MDATTDDALLALGEQCLQNFLLRRKVDELQQEVARQANLIVQLEDQPTKLPVQEVG